MAGVHGCVCVCVRVSELCTLSNNLLATPTGNQKQEEKHSSGYSNSVERKTEID